jgi:hypothetical protein
MSARPGSSRSKLCALALVACAVWGCEDDERETAQAAATQEALTNNEPVAPPPAPKPASPDAPGYPKPGWSKVTVDDKVPICAVTSYDEQYKYKFAHEVKKQKFTPPAEVVFAAFGPWCVNEKCDDLPSLQCSVKREGDSLLVHTHYWGYHKDGTSCTETCRTVTAGCKTPALEAGVYTVVHGDQSYKLKIPSVLRAPCFGAKE